MPDVSQNALFHSRLLFFPEKVGAVSDEQGERFHQDILAMKHRYQGMWNPAMMGVYCRFLIRETDEAGYKKNKGFLFCIEYASV